MPELPDLLYIKKKLIEVLPGKKITECVIDDPIIIRNMLAGTRNSSVIGETISNVFQHGPFLRIELSLTELVFNFMLTGRLQYRRKGEKKTRDTCISFFLDSDDVLNYADDKSMGKIYMIEKGHYENIPGYVSQGIDVLSPDFSFEYFFESIRKKRSQVRVFLMDQTIISAIGNAYADEILFEAKIHPKTWCYSLSEEAIRVLYDSIGKVLTWGMQKVEEAGKPIEIKVRDHMKVRNRNNTPCPRCGTTIRRANVLGYDSFFCPGCQPQTRKHFIPWENI